MLLLQSISFQLPCLNISEKKESGHWIYSAAHWQHLRPWAGEAAQFTPAASNLPADQVTSQGCFYPVFCDFLLWLHILHNAAME